MRKSKAEKICHSRSVRRNGKAKLLRIPEDLFNSEKDILELRDQVKPKRNNGN